MLHKDQTLKMSSPISFDQFEKFIETLPELSSISSETDEEHVFNSVVRNMNETHARKIEQDMLRNFLMHAERASQVADNMQEKIDALVHESMNLMDAVMSMKKVYTRPPRTVAHRIRPEYIDVLDLSKVDDKVKNEFNLHVYDYKW